MVEIIQIFDQGLNALVVIVFKYIPIQVLGAVPLQALGEFTTHKQQLFAGMGKHIGIKQTHIGEFLPIIAGHFIEYRLFAVNHFIVGERQQEVFGERIQHAEGQHVVMVFAVNGFLRHVTQGIVHPAHVPFQIKTQPADVHRATHLRP